MLTYSFIHPKFGKFRDFSHYTENSVFMTGFHNSVRIFRIAEIIRPYILTSSDSEVPYCPSKVGMMTFNVPWHAWDITDVVEIRKYLVYQRPYFSHITSNPFNKPIGFRMMEPEIPKLDLIYRF